MEVEKLIDITSDLIAPFLDLLLMDKSTKKNIIWATDTYEELGDGFTDKVQMRSTTLLRRPDLIRPRIQKSQEAQAQRTRKKAEVFTPAWLCNRMNNYCDDDWFGRSGVFNTENDDHTWTVSEEPITFPKKKKWQHYVDSRRLEITCGEAPYLVSRYDVSTGNLIIPTNRRIGMLDRKIRIVNENTDTYEEWLKWTIRAFEASYGYEYQGDNVLIARINLLLTFADYYEERWEQQPEDKLLQQIANKIVWNIWQMDGIKNTVPLGKPYEKYQLVSLFDMSSEEISFQEGLLEARPCKIYNWRRDNSMLFHTVRERVKMEKKLFNFVIGNPPYQKESSESISESNGQKPMTNIFQYFQEAADEITKDTSVLIYPGGRWIHQSGKGMQNFGKQQINDEKLSVVEFYPDASELFGNAASLSDGITIVTKNHHKRTKGFTYIYSRKGEKISIHAENPGDKLMPLDPNDLPIEQKIHTAMTQYGLKYLHDAILPRSLFSIESDFVEKNPDKVRKYNKNDKIDYSKEIKLFTNDKAGKAGRATWFVTDKAVITKNANYIGEWQVVVSSANAGGQKRDNQLEIIDNHSAFGRSRLALRSFKTYKEAQNFYNYVCSYFIRYTFLLTDEALTSLGKEVPDLADYSDDNKYINFHQNIDLQLCKLFKINDKEFAYIKNCVDSLRGPKK